MGKKIDIDELTDHDRLIRIDENLKETKKNVRSLKTSIKCSVKSLNDSLSTKVENNDEFKKMKEQIDDYTKIKNKAVGFVLGAGVVAGLTGSGITYLITSISKVLASGF